MSNSVSLTFPSLKIFGKFQTEVFPNSEFLANFLQRKTDITPELLMSMTSNLNQELNFTRRIRKCQKKKKKKRKKRKKSGGGYFEILSRHCHFSNFKLSLSNIEAKIQTHDQ